MDSPRSLLPLGAYGDRPDTRLHMSVHMSVWDPDRIVVGIDGSVQSIRAARVGARMVELRDPNCHRDCGAPA